ncbi:MAG: RHS repeat domain-containing protein, partial [Aureispira sp.]
QHQEGRIIRDLIGVDVHNQPIYDYSLKDHLGNNRVFFSDVDKNGVVDVAQSGNANELLQQEHYYPFGMGIRGEWKFVQPQIGGVNQYQYNGIELNDDFGLNWNMAFYRSYDPSIGRWNAVDPLAEKYFSMSPYNGMGNNPIKFIDPDGDEIRLKGRKKDREEFLRLLNQNSDVKFIMKGRRLEVAGRNEMTKEQREDLGVYETTLLAGIEDEQKISYKIVPAADYIDFDDYQYGDIDLQDLKRSDDIAFQSTMIHITTERFATDNYDRKTKTRKGREQLSNEYGKAHKAAHDAEEKFFQEKFPNVAKNIRFNGEGLGNQNLDKGNPYHEIEKDFGALKKVYRFPLYPKSDGRTYNRKTDDHVTKSYIKVH